MHEITRLIESLRPGENRPNGKSRLQQLGYISCASTVDIRHVPFYDPCLILVMSGRKAIYRERTAIYCEAGNLISVPAPSSFDLRNEPDRRSGRYTALLIPFKIELLDRLSRSHNLVDRVAREAAGVLEFTPDAVVYASIRHYLETVGNPLLQDHRLMEILLLLAGMRPELLSYGLHRDNWSQRVRAILATDLAHPWDLRLVCRRLATTESTLRRQLRREGTGFRELLYELRLSTALVQLLQTSHPVNRIALDCGYQSVSRFTSNFHKRFGLPPAQFRESATESEHNLVVSGQS